MGRTKDITERYENQLRQQKNQQTVTLRCTFCPWQITGTLGDTRTLAAAHRTEQHPDAIQRTRFAKRRAGHRPLGSRSLDENIALTRAQGGALWVTDETTI